MSIEVERLTHIYNAGTPLARTALHEVSLRIADGACVAIVGVTGSGKSTLVQHFNGLLRPSAGTVVVDGLRVGARDARGAALLDLRRRVGLLFQFPESQLFAPTVYADVAFGPERLGLPEEEVRARVAWALEAVALGQEEALLQRSPFALSGGQRRRVALAGVLAMRPSTLVLDEPSAGLDAEARAELYATLRALRTREGLTLVLVSHDMAEVAALAEEVHVLAEGALRLSGRPHDVFAQSAALEACGILAPPLAQVASLARARGLAIPPQARSVEELAQALHAAVRGAGDAG